MTEIGYLVILVVIFGAAGIVLFYRYSTKRTLNNINNMLERAMEGEFKEEHFDESMLSSLETKFAKYLARVSASEQTLQSEKENIKSLIADISHQTKTPIANVLLYTQLLGEQNLNAESEILVMELESQAKKLQVLIEALIKTSRLETGVISLHPVRENIENVIYSAVSQVRPKARQKEIELKIESVKGEALFDPKWTEEAIVNLLDNAIKYTPKGGSVSINVTEYQMFSCINVTDTGYGISEEEQPKVFLRFYRGLEYQSEEGIGIGLYLVRQIAEGQGGYVRIQSVKGQGATFSLYMPKE